MSVGVLRRQRRLVREKALAVRQRRQALEEARARLYARLRAELARPAVMLGFFAAGLGYGLARGRRAEGRAASGLGGLIAAAIAVAQRMAAVRRADRALGRH